MLTLLFVMVTAPALPAPNVLVWARNDAERAFVKQAKTFVASQKLVPITLDEVNVKLEAERVKDVLGCDDVSCISDITGAYGIKYVVRIHPLEFLITLHDITQMGKTVAEISVSIIKEEEEVRIEVPPLLTGYDTGDYDDIHQKKR